MVVAAAAAAAAAEEEEEEEEERVLTRVVPNGTEGTERPRARARCCCSFRKCVSFVAAISFPQKRNARARRLNSQ